MIRKYYTWIVLLCLLVVSVVSGRGATLFPTRLLDPSVAGLSVSVVGSGAWRPFPYYAPSSGEALEISFDLLGGELIPFTYTLTHCDAHWQPSSLLPSEYISGFEKGEVTDSQLSEATRQNYRHYRLILNNTTPSRPKLSGNYLLRIYRDGAAVNDPAIEVAFALLDPIASIAAVTTPITHSESYGAHQQVNVETTLPMERVRVINPQEELCLVVGQNGRRDNAVWLTKPSGISGQNFRYEDFQAALFEAGNEYHAFEILNDNRAGMGIEHIVTEDEEHSLYLFAQQNRHTMEYLQTQDANGRYVIRSIETGGAEAVNTDYYRAYFTYWSDPLPEGQSLYLSGEAFDLLPLSERRLQYDAEQGAYRGAVWFKGGYVSFTYLSSSDGVTFTTSLTEGNHYQTNNLYTILVYYRPMGARYDALIGIGTAETNTR